MSLEDFVNPATSVIAVVIAVVAAMEALKAGRSMWWVFTYVMLAALAIFFSIWQAKLQSDAREKQDNESAELKGAIADLKLVIVEKEKAAAEANEKYLKISREQLSLNYALSVDLIYDHAAHQFKIYNRGKTNIFLWGNKYASAQSLEKEPRIISPNKDTFYYIQAEQVEKDAVANLGKNGEARVPIEFYFTNEKSERYISKFILWIVVVDGRVTIHTQNTEIKKADWSTLS